MQPRVSALNALITFCYVILFMFLVRLIAARYPENAYSKALTYLT